MRNIYLISLLLFFSTNCFSQIANTETYLGTTKNELHKTWPNNRTVNLVFHGHSVPSGYFATPNVNTLASYPYTTLVNLKSIYPYAVLNTITTSIGGENSEKGELRFVSEVLCMRPDVVFIDYAINDRGIGLARARTAWIKMIEAAQLYGCKIILLTPTPVSTESLTDPQAPLALHAEQIKELAALYHIGLVDSYKTFQDLHNAGINLSSYYAQPNHVNEKGHKLVADEIKKWFITQQTQSVDVYFDFENNTSTGTTDKLANVTGTFYNSSVVNDNERGNVLSLSDSQSYMMINTNPLNNNEFTISFWLKIVVEEFNKYVFHFAEASGKHLLGLTKENWFTPKQFCFYNNTVSGIVGTGVKLDPDIWYHLAVTGKNGVSNMYLNGEKKNTRNILALNGLTFTDFYVGSPNNSTAISFIDDVYINKKQLSDTEILNLYNSQKVAIQSISQNLVSKIYVYPNPVKSNEKVNIDLSSLSVNDLISYSISTIDGKHIIFQSGESRSINKLTHTFENKGIYLVNFNSKNKSSTIKVTVI